MTSNEGALNLFIAYEQEANRLVSLLENASYSLDPHIVINEDYFTGQLKETPPDLVLAGYTEENAALIKTIFGELRKNNLDIPVILINPEIDSQKVLQGLRLGAADVVTLDEDQQLLQIVSRVLYDLEQRRNRVYWKERFKDSEKRNLRLMDSSRDAVAIIAEGTYVYVNDSYAQLFGYDGGDALMLFPVIDTAQESFMEQLKPYLKPLSDEQSLSSSSLPFLGVREDQSSFTIDIEVSQIEYEGEPSLQFLISKEKLAEADPGIVSAETPSDSDTTPAATPISSPAPKASPEPRASVPGDINLQRMLDHINAAIRKASKTHTESLLYYFRLDNFATLQRERGFQVTEAAARAIAKFLKTKVQVDDHLERIGADAYLLMTPNNNPEASKKLAEDLIQACSNEVFEVEDQTINAQFSVGISTVSESFESAEVSIDRCLKALANIQDDEEQESRVQLFEELFPTSMATLGEDENIRQYVQQLLQKNLLVMAYQPIVALQDQEFEYYEAFCRPNVDTIPEGMPENFFAQVFKTEMAEELDKWIILRALKEMQSTIPSKPNTRVFIKISGMSLKNEKFAGWVQAALKATKLNTQHLIFQIEEKDVSWSMKDAQTLVEVLHKANSIVTLTHYGVNSDADTLKKIKFDFVKPDQTLVKKAAKTTDGADTLSDCINMLKGEGLKVIVPFVEDASVIPSLWKLGVDYIQGNYIQTPRAAMDYQFDGEE